MKRHNPIVKNVNQMIGLKQKKILKVFSDHIGNQEAEINQILSVLSDYRKKYGDLGLGDSIVNQRVDIERQLQEVRGENQTVQLQLNTKENELKEQEHIFKEMDVALQKLTSQNVTKELSSLQSDVTELEKRQDSLDTELKEIEDKLNELLSTKTKMV